MVYVVSHETELENISLDHPENLIEFHPTDHKILDHRKSFKVIEQDVGRYLQLYNRLHIIYHIIRSLVQIILHYTKN